MHLHLLSRPRTRWLGLALWGLLLVVVSLLTGLRPEHRNVGLTYVRATGEFWRGEPLYGAMDGSAFLYLPQFCLLYTPFWYVGEAIDSALGHVLWRWFQIGLYGLGIWRLSRLLAPPGGRDSFLALTLLVFPGMIGATRNGQSNLLLGATMLHAAVSLARLGGGRAVGWLTLGMAAKPLAAVPILLAPWNYRRMLLPMLAAMTVFGIAPFLVRPADYVLDLYRAFGDQLRAANSTPEHRFCDLHGLLRSVGLEIPREALTVLRVIAAAATLGLWLRARRWPEPDRALAFLGLSAGYLMLFNPLTESNSYAILAPALAAWAVLVLERDNRSRAGWMLVALAIGIGCNNYGDPIHPWTNLWFKALCTMVFVGWLAGRVLGGRYPDSQIARAPD